MVNASKNPPRKAPKTQRQEKTIRTLCIILGIIILGYIYTDSLLAQQSSQPRISINQAVDFPNDI